MKIFLSWSGKTSKEVALVLEEWLQSVIQGVDIFISENHIEKGTRGLNRIAKELENINFGILCICNDNIKSPWINFEAGALSKFIDQSYVAPFLFNLSRSEMSNSPLSQFQSTIFEKEDIKKLVLTIFKSIPNNKVSEKIILKSFELLYPELERNLNNIPSDYIKKDNYSCIDDTLRKPILSNYNPDLYIPLEKNFCDLKTYKNCQTTVFPNINVLGDVVDKVTFIPNKGYKFNGKNMISVHLDHELPYDTDARTFIFAVQPTAKPKDDPIFFFSYGQRRSHECGDGINNHDKSFGMFWGEPKPDENIEEENKGNGLRVFFYCEHCKKDRTSKNCDTPAFYNFEQINTWYIVAVTYNGEILKVYIDGECVFEENYILKTSITPYLNLGGFVHHNEDGAMIAKDLDYTMKGYLREFMMFRDYMNDTKIQSLSHDIRTIVTHS